MRRNLLFVDAIEDDLHSQSGPCLTIQGRMHACHLAFQDLGSHGVVRLLDIFDTLGLSEVLLWCLVDMVASYWLLGSLVADGTFVLDATLFDEGMALSLESATGYPSDVVSSMKGRWPQSEGKYTASIYSRVIPLKGQCWSRNSSSWRGSANQ